MKFDWGYDLTGYSNEDKGDPLKESKRLAEKAIKRLNVYKLAVEYLYHRDQYDSDEMLFAQATEKAWDSMTQNQKDVVYMHTIQGFSFSAIADLQGKDPSTISRTFSAACKKTQKKISE